MYMADPTDLGHGQNDLKKNLITLFGNKKVNFQKLQPTRIALYGTFLLLIILLIFYNSALQL